MAGRSLDQPGADDALERVQEPRWEYADDTTQEAAEEPAPPKEAAEEPAPPTTEEAPQPGDGNGSADLDERAARPSVDQPTAEFPGPAPKRGD